MAPALRAAALAAPLALCAAAEYPVVVTQHADAQCPCSAQFIADIVDLLDSPGFAPLVDFRQYFVGGTGKGAGGGDSCIHGKEECVGQHYFECAHPYTNESGVYEPKSFRESEGWLRFQRCSMGTCTGCAAILGARCPCTNYTTFPQTDKNDVMKDCAAAGSMDWAALQACAGGGEGSTLQAANSARSAADKVTYGVQGLPVVHVNGVHVKTKQLIPVVCGPTPKEVRAAVCAAITAAGKAAPAECGA